MEASKTEGRLIVATDFKEHDSIAKVISDLNYSLGLKTVLGGAWTYDKLASNGAKVLNISFQDAYRLGVNKLIELI